MIPSLPADPPPRAHETSVPPFRVHALEFGSGAETVVLLHGLSGSSRWWDRNAPALAASYRVVVPDLIGFGRSRAARRVPSPAETADLIAGWLSALGIECVHLIGHSMGGQIAVHFAVRHPARLGRLVLVDPAGLPRSRSASKIARFGMEIAALWRWGDPRFYPTIVHDAWAAGPRTLARAIGHILADDVRPLLPRVQAPTLIIWGEHDTWVPLSDAAVFRGALPDARLVVLHGTAHNPMVDRPGDFNRLVLHFLRGEEVGH